MRRAPKTGTITKDKRKMRKPYMARVTIRTWHDEQGKKHEQKKLIGYFETKREAQEALDQYNTNKEHINIEYKNIKFEKLWTDWQKTKINDRLSENTLKGYKFSYDKITDNIKNMQFVNINFNDLQSMIDNLKANKMNYNSLRKVKNSLSQLYKYAIKCDIVNKNYAELLDIGKSPRKGETLIFKDEELKQLQNIFTTEQNEDTLLTAQIIYMLIYNGCRISEFLNLKTEDIDIKNKIFKIKKAKTEAGDRRIPIHNGVLNIYQEIYDKNNEYFLTNPKTGKKFSYANFRDSYWDRLRNLLNWNENLTPHNCRKTCASLMRKYDVNSTYQKMILGHEGALDLTEKVYTYIDDDQLKEAINKIEIKNY